MWHKKVLTSVIAIVVAIGICWGVLFWLSQPFPVSTPKTKPLTANDLTFESKWREESLIGCLIDVQLDYSWDLADWQKEPGLASGQRIGMTTLRKSHLPYDEIAQVVEVYKSEDMAKQAFNVWKYPTQRLWSSNFESNVGFALDLPQIGDESKAWTLDHDEWEAIKYVMVFRKGRIVEGIAVDYTLFNRLDRANWFTDTKTKKEWFLKLCVEAEGYIK